MEKVAIIGMGISGLGVLLSYEKELKKSDVEIHCYDYKMSVGRGFPFRDDSDQVLLNARPTTISYDYEKPDEFGNWLKDENYEYHEYVPRHILGDYLFMRYESTKENTNTTYMEHPAVDIEYLEDNKTFIITDRDGKETEYDRVHLCCGEIPPQDFYNLKDYDNYIHKMYPLKEKLKDIKEDESICIIGTGLSGVDASRFSLTELGLKEIYIFSRNNVFPSAREDEKTLETKYFTDEKMKSLLENNNGVITFEEFEDIFNKELEYQDISFRRLMNRFDNSFDAIELSLKGDEELQIAQNLFTNITNPLNTTWLGFSILDKEKFKEKYDDYIQIFGGPTPMSTGNLLSQGKKDKRLTILEDVEDIVFDQKSKMFHMIDKDEKVLAKSKYVINATGVDSKLDSLSMKSTFVGKLLDKLYVQVDGCGGITVLKDNLNVVSPKYGAFDNLHAHGVLISGIQLRNNSIPTIQETAHNCIKSIYKK